jgi:hypothetical protein
MNLAACRRVVPGARWEAPRGLLRLQAVCGDNGRTLSALRDINMRTRENKMKEASNKPVSAQRTIVSSALNNAVLYLTASQQQRQNYARKHSDTASVKLSGASQIWRSQKDVTSFITRALSISLIGVHRFDLNTRIIIHSHLFLFRLTYKPSSTTKSKFLGQSFVRM